MVSSQPYWVGSKTKPGHSSLDMDGHQHAAHKHTHVRTYVRTYTHTCRYLHGTTAFNTIHSSFTCRGSTDTPVTTTLRFLMVLQGRPDFLCYELLWKTHKNKPENEDWTLTWPTVRIQRGGREGSTVALLNHVLKHLERTKKCPDLFWTDKLINHLKFRF